MGWNIDHDRPIWMQLNEQLMLRIVTGEYPLGGRVPTVRELAEDAGVNPNTMQRALAHLEEQGLVITNRTAGRQVTEDEEKIRSVRLQLAEKKIAEFLPGMRDLGFEEQEVLSLLSRKE